MGNGWRHAAAYDGVDADARLDAAIASASAGDVIYLEKTATYATDRTINKRLKLIGTNAWADGSEVSGGTWTFDAECRLEGMLIRDPSSGNGVEVAPGAAHFAISDCVITGTVNIDEDIARVTDVTGGGEIVFTSNTSGRIVDASAGIKVTDNGSNTIGDIA
ncbi:hypothetical protein [Halobacterium salinarum]|uniref:Pectin lyase domain protein n=3 Tax=Halobacterium salinarum TaxID=2242 RepID=A0A510N3V4_HALSA|nr:hypothetical protein [Halobacterium salinarum]MBB6091016.1 hypothetical protein [Halobacterium salinarum]UEB92107.1 hypothetical protein LJ422_00270 [Halobacterium salinarum NRC-34001]CAP12940.1 pectin lyase domain protein [Halobacterium salinarum R1]DAC77381.1 TPA_inf: pectin lyase domain protein [Halobacterium salinarum NRC-1]